MDTQTLLIIVGGLLMVGMVALVLRRSWGSFPTRADRTPSASAWSNPAPGLALELGPEAEAQIQELMARGQKIEAIKRVRELTGLGLKEAKDYVEGRSSGLAPSAMPAAARPIGPLTPQGEQELRALLSQGDQHKIEAIKRLRELTGMGLKEAKDYVEAILSAASIPGAPLPQPAQASAARATGAEVERAARELLSQGDQHKIEAIRRVRELTGMGLKEAKDYVEALERTL